MPGIGSNSSYNVAASSLEGISDTLRHTSPTTEEGSIDDLEYAFSLLRVGEN